ncbi:hypothetical protein HHI36_001504, partial [Cryptolaemus montrouzieri]
MNLVKFLKHKLKKDVEKRIKDVDSQKISISENKSKAIREIIKSRTNTKYNSKDNSKLSPNDLNKFFAEIGEKLSGKKKTKTSVRKELPKKENTEQVASMFFAATLPAEIIQI